MKKICIISTRHISYNPRVLKEADTLYANGYDITVVTINNRSDQRRFDEEMMQSRKWKLRTVNFRREGGKEKARWLYLSLKQRLFISLSKITPKYGIAERAAEKAFDGLVALAKAEKADLYITHHAEALGAGFRASRYNKAKFGFDAEDFHTGMKESSGASSDDTEDTEDTEDTDDKRIAFLEGKYLPHCDYLTAASKGIAVAYQRKYGIAQPDVLLNVFPFEELPVRPVNDPVKFYWYSQVIGPNRGLELLLTAAGQIGLPFEIHLRGRLYCAEYKDTLKTFCAGSGIWDQVFFHPPILAEQLIGDANRFDVGLALESDISVNRNICVTNKVFSYLMSRLMIIGSDTDGQKDIFSHFPGAVGIFRINDAEDLAKTMIQCIVYKDKLEEAKKAAGTASLQTFNWQLESKKLLRHVTETLN
jgi:hypothetical protein